MISPERREKARELARLSRRLSLLETAAEGILLLLFLFSGLAAGLRDLLPGAFLLRVGVFTLITGAAYEVIFSPLSYYQGYVLPRRYGLSVQGFRGWLADHLKGWALGLFLGLVAGLAIYWLLAAYPATWWLWASLFLVLLSILLTHLAPVLILPLFLKLQPLTDPELGRRLNELARRAGVRIKGVFVADLSARSTTSNAGLMGIGATRRIVVSDTLIAQYTPDEIEAVLAHELGHHAHRDIPRLILVQAGLLLVSFYLAHLALRRFSLPLGLEGPADIAGFPLLMLVLGGLFLVASPLVKGFSRRIESAADSYALGLARLPQAFLTALAKLTDQNLAEARPPRWEEWLFYDHPPFYRRKANVERYMASSQ
ncbi:MAG: M48 family metallopeptidase [Chloroflexi bacterium]|nr:M48 family metallopeptidase [Chloroflexota bacterium]